MHTTRHNSSDLLNIIKQGRPQEAIEKLQSGAEQRNWLPLAFTARQWLRQWRELEGELWHNQPGLAERDDREVERNQLKAKAIELIKQFRLWEADPEQASEAFYDKHRRKIDLFMAGQQQRRAGQTKAAIQTFTTVIEAEPAFTEAYIERGTLLMQGSKPDWKQALEDLNQALLISPSHPLALTNRGYLYVQYYHDRHQACEDWKKVQEMGLPLADALIQQYCNKP
ncbi:MAG: hypothetical protein RIC19_15405 [Phaeodactylibacter sp.]|uniref:tetratricopeptide repeat protein n=1 Tax=Phaeodactylibacter sp. TaxID=1940289 RepID=UPI0032ED55FD